MSQISSKVIIIMGVLHGIAAVLPIMIAQKSGHILATDSVSSHVVYPGSAVYCGTKFAVRAIMEGLRQEQQYQGHHHLARCCTHRAV